MSPTTSKHERREQEAQPPRRWPRRSTPYIPLPRNGIEGRDVRAKRPPVLSFLLRMETLRRVTRIVSLLALDLAGVVAAIFTALALKAAVRDEFDAARA